MSDHPPKPPPEPPAFGGGDDIDLSDDFPFKQPPDFEAPPELPPPLPELEPPPPPLDEDDVPTDPERSAQEIHATPPVSLTPPPFSETPPKPPQASFGGGHAMTWGGTTSQSDRNIALLAHLTNALVWLIPVPILPALAIFLLYKDKSKFVAYHALQATAMSALIWTVGLFTCLGAVLGVGLSIIWGLKAYEGKWEGFPALDQIGR